MNAISPLRLSEPGLYLMPPATYHSDPWETPSLSHGIIRTILERTMRAAKQEHPRTSDDYEPSLSTEAMDDGTVMHWLLLEAGAPPVIVDADDWRKKEPRILKTEAQRAGRVAILRYRFEEFQKCAKAVLGQMREDRDCDDFFGPGDSEVAMFWYRGPVPCRAMIDRRPRRAGAPIYNLKATGIIGGARPEKYDRTMRTRNATGAVHYLEGATSLALANNEKPPCEERYIVFETKKPYDMSVMAPGPALLEVAQQDVIEATKKWYMALYTGEWPGYARGTQYIEANWWDEKKAIESSQPAITQDLAA